MTDKARTCTECQGAMSPVVIMDKNNHGNFVPSQQPQQLEYRQPDDRKGSWTGKYPSAGQVQAFMCEGCGRIALYGAPPDA